MGPKLYNAVSLYKYGVEDGHLAAVLEKVVSSDVLQHTPGVAPGRDGLRAALTPLIERYPQRRVHPLRGFEDGSTVVLHTYQTFAPRHLELVTIDVFDTDGDNQIIEHWSASTPLRRTSLSGYSQIDGEAVPRDAERTEANKVLVTNYVRRCLVERRLGSLDRYVNGALAQHDPDIPGGLAGLAWYLRQPHARRTVAVERLVGYGNFVATAGWYEQGGQRFAGCELYRVAAGRIVECWNTVHPAGVLAPWLCAPPPRGPQRRG